MDPIEVRVNGSNPRRALHAATKATTGADFSVARMPRGAASSTASRHGPNLGSPIGRVVEEARRMPPRSYRTAVTGHAR
jgi:hypothetical protein